MLSLATLASRNVSDTLAIALEHTPQRAAVVVIDERCELSRVLARAYAECLPEARILDFDKVEPAAVKQALDALQEHDLAVLIQSSVFRIPEFRIRVELYRRNIKVVEHSNLERMQAHELEHYVAALAYDPAYYRELGHALKARMDAASSARVVSDGELLHFACPLEPAKLNIGHFAGLKNVGSQFPIGEVFTEARELERVDGRVKIYAFADASFRLNAPAEPITLLIERGRVVDALNSTSDFELVLGAIRADEGEVWLRELGFGMNRAFSRERRVSDVGAFERVCGVHLSLGARHGVYKKPHLNPREVRYHVDTFVVTDQVLLDDQVVFGDGAWRPTPTSLVAS
jgi:aminopeptidase